MFESANQRISESANQRSDVSGVGVAMTKWVSNAVSLTPAGL